MKKREELSPENSKMMFKKASPLMKLLSPPQNGNGTHGKVSAHQMKELIQELMEDETACRDFYQEIADIREQRLAQKRPIAFKNNQKYLDFLLEKPPNVSVN